MTEEHPEELLDVALAGRLTPWERTVLDAHLAACAACALHLGAAASIRTTGAVGPRDENLNRWAVTRAMAAWDPGRGRRGWGVSPRWGWLVAAGVFLLATAVSAKLWRAKVSSTNVVRPNDTAAASMTPPHRARTSPVAATDQVPPADPTTEAPPPRHVAQQTAAELFSRARELGREGKIDAALAIHLRLQRSYPKTAEAGLSSALAGRLLLERHRPAEALAQFDRHLARGGAAEEEAFAGRAQALQQLERQQEEAVAWRALLERHPGSVYAERARGRLRDLSLP